MQLGRNPDTILDDSGEIEEMDPETDMNLQHLLRATNHLKIAQDEFEAAKRQLAAKGINIQQQLLKMNKQVASAPPDFSEYTDGNDRYNQLAG